MLKPRGGPFFNRSFSGEHNSSSIAHNPSGKPSFSSLFSEGALPPKPLVEPFPSESQPLDDDGVYLQISNLDQWYDEANLRNYLMGQLKPITPILALTIETPSIAKVKVPSIQVSGDC